VGTFNYGIWDATDTAPNCTEDAHVIVSELRLAGVVLTGGNDLSHVDSAVCPAIERDKFEYKLLDVCAKKIFLFWVFVGDASIGTYYRSGLVVVKGHVANRHALVVHDNSLMPLNGVVKLIVFIAMVSQMEALVVS